MLGTILAKKEYMTQLFDEKGKKAIPCTILSVKKAAVCGIRTAEKDGYNAVVIGLGKKRNPNKPDEGKYKELGYVPAHIREVRTDSIVDYKVGQNISVTDFVDGDKIKLHGMSKGKGFQGVVKRWGFHGGPKTHGQSDRVRHPGAIGTRTIPGRVFKGKKMGGRMGTDNLTLNSIIVGVNEKEGLILVRGAVPGGRNSLIMIEKK